MKSVRLSKHIKPERYQLTIRPDLESFTFEGHEAIFLVLEQSVNQITLHAKELKIFDTKIRIQNQEFRIKDKNIVYDIKNETVTFTFNQALPKGRGELRLNFKG